SDKYGNPSRTGKQDDQVIPVTGVFRFAVWSVGAKQLFAAAAHEDPGAPILLMLGTVDAGGREKVMSLPRYQTYRPASKTGGTHGHEELDLAKVCLGWLGCLLVLPFLPMLIALRFVPMNKWDKLGNVNWKTTWKLIQEIFK